MILARGMHGG